jgi:glucosamine 6-phosphate synthetase-like amidotransferase/phosphosugar isomerase protein
MKTPCASSSARAAKTIDTLFALREAKARGAKILSIVNVVGSAIANESDDVLYTWAGPEIAVATTKAYSTQLAVFYLVTLQMGLLRGKLTQAEVAAQLTALEALPAQAQALLEQRENLQYLASLYFNQHDIFFIGRNLDYSLALEGSLKLKEISYIHSEAYAAGELKHGTISLIEQGTLVVALCTTARCSKKWSAISAKSRRAAPRSSPSRRRARRRGGNGRSRRMAARRPRVRAAVAVRTAAAVVRVLRRVAQGLRYR